MLGILILLFTVMPLVELYFLLKAASVFGGLNTFLVVLVTGVVGAFLAKSQGRIVYSNLQKKVAKGLTPTDEMLQGLLILVGGVLLVTPGFVTDAIGFLMVFPLSQKLLVMIFKKRLISRVSKAGRASKGGAVFYTNVNINQTWPSQEPEQNSVRDVTPKKLSKNFDSSDEE